MTDQDQLDALADCDDALTLAEAALDAAVRERDELREALRESCQFCHHPIGWHTFEDGHPSGEMAPWCYCSAQFIGRLAALDAAVRERDELREAADAFLDEFEAAARGDVPMNGHYQRQALDRLRAALLDANRQDGPGE